MGDLEENSGDTGSRPASWCGPLLLLPLAVIGAVAWITLAYIATLDLRPSRLAVRDDGFVQIWTIVFIGIAFLIIPIRFRLRHIGPRIPVMFLLLLYMARELDLHTYFTNEPVTRPKTFFDTADPLHVRIIAGIITLSVIVYMVHCLLRLMPYCVDGLRRLRPWALYSCLWVALIVAAQLVDKNSKVGGVGDRVEEVIELCAAILTCFIVAMLPRELPLLNRWGTRSPAAEPPALSAGSNAC